MDFDLSDEQKMLSEMVSRFVADTYDFQAREKIQKTQEGWSREVYAGLTEFLVDFENHMRLENEVLFPQFEPGGRAQG